MRLAPLVTLALALPALLAGAAGAQSATETLEVEVAIVDAPLDPLGGSVTVPVRVTVPCRHLAGGPGSGVVALAPASTPPWLVASVAPERIAIDPAGCASLAYAAEAALTLSVTEDAPAFVATAMAVSASVSSAAGEESAEGVAVVQAGYFSRLLAGVAEASPTVRPEGVATFPVTLANAGNANTKVSFEIVDVPEGWTLPLPQSVNLESRQHGGAVTETTVLVTVQAPVKRAQCDGVAEVALRLHPAYALDASVKGTPVSLTLAPRCETGADLPSPAAVAAGLAAAAAAALLPRRPKRS